MFLINKISTNHHAVYHRTEWTLCCPLFEWFEHTFFTSTKRKKKNDSQLIYCQTKLKISTKLLNLFYTFFFSFSSWCLRNVHRKKIVTSLTRYTLCWFACWFFSLFFLFVHQFKKETFFFCFQLFKVKLNQFTVNDDDDEMCFFFTLTDAKQKKNWFLWRKTRVSHFWKWIKTKNVKCDGDKRCAELYMWK